MENSATIGNEQPTGQAETALEVDIRGSPIPVLAALALLHWNDLVGRWLTVIPTQTAAAAPAARRRLHQTRAW